MNKTDVVAEIAGRTGLPRQRVSESLTVILDVITDALVRGERVSLPGLGSLVPAERAARSGVNPASGEKIQIAAQKSVSFRPAGALKEAVAGS